MSYMDTQNQLAAIQNNTAATNAEKLKANGAKTTLDQDAFLQLMMAQMKNQDPMSPMDTNAMLQQEASITQVSETQKLSKNIESLANSTAVSNSFMQANSLIGKEVNYTNPDYDEKDSTSKKTLSGKVTEVKLYSDATTVMVGDKEVLLSQISSVKQSS